MKKTPHRVTFDDTRVRLSRLERFVLSRVDGQLSVTDLVELTGLAPPQVEQIISKLASWGAIEVREESSLPRLDELLADAPLADANEVLEELPGETPRGSGHWIADSLPEPSEAPEDDYAVPVQKPHASASTAPQAPHAPPAAEALPEADENQPSLVPAEGDITDPNEAHPTEVQNYRKLYETELRELSLPERLEKARTESGPVLFALCFDQDPQIVKGILENDRMNLDHARLIAANHRSPVGLEAICQRVALVKDARVQRMLLRNVQLTEALMKRLLTPKRLLEIYKASVDRDIPDKTRTGAKSLFKAKFGHAAPEEKFEIIWNTEGRVLPHLLGQTLDQKTAALFCARNFASVVLIQAFARFPATPPGILAHMLKQPLVKRQVHLRNLILQHPNVPSEAKRKA